MPSRAGVVIIVLFWLGVTGYVLDRDVWPRLFGDAPPAVRIDLSDEATQLVAARWVMYRGGQKVGTVTTRMNYVPEDNTFRFTSTYKDLWIEQPVLKLRVRVELSECETTMTVTRDGRLRGQTLTGQLVGRLIAGPLVVNQVEAKADIQAVVRDGQLVGQCAIHSDLVDLSEPLDPVPVPDGQVMNPLQPVGRLRDVRPGQRWVIREINPLSDALTVLVRGTMKKYAGTQLANFDPQSADRQTLIAKVSDRLEPLPETYREKSALAQGLWLKPEPRPECWVIEYRGEESTAKTWVRAPDGKVLRQEASRQGETLVLERED